MTPKAIVVHHEAGNNGFDSVNESHKKRWPDFKSSLGYHVGYQYYISKDGVVKQARSETEDGAHTLGGWNHKAVGICLMGNFMNEDPTPAQIGALERLIEKVRLTWSIPKKEVYGHRDLWSTACPGDSLYEWVNEYKNAIDKDVAKLKNLLQQMVDALTKLLNKLKNK